MTADSRFADYSTRLGEFIRRSSSSQPSGTLGSIRKADQTRFNELALDLFALQYESNPPYQRFCSGHGVTPSEIRDWADIPALPVAAFKELEMTSLSAEERGKVFLSSGTTGQKPSRHWHNDESLRAYEASILGWFGTCWANQTTSATQSSPGPLPLLFLTPPPVLAPHSSLVHMFECIRGAFGAVESGYAGVVDPTLGWVLDGKKVEETLARAVVLHQPVGILGTAFNFVHLLDYLMERGISYALPVGSRVFETGGYKGRSRSLSKTELYSSITRSLAIPPSHIISEYGMSELSSQAYDRRIGGPELERRFQFPPWACAQIVSPETGREVEEGGAGLIRVCDLANVRSVLAIQTEDLGVRCGEGFTLLGRAARAEPRGCSLMAV